jgi:transcription elongation factor Elf1
MEENNAFNEMSEKLRKEREPKPEYPKDAYCPRCGHLIASKIFSFTPLRQVLTCDSCGFTQIGLAFSFGPLKEVK